MRLASSLARAPGNRAFGQRVADGEGCDRGHVCRGAGDAGLWQAAEHVRGNKVLHPGSEPAAITWTASTSFPEYVPRWTAQACKCADVGQL